MRDRRNVFNRMYSAVLTCFVCIASLLVACTSHAFPLPAAYKDNCGTCHMGYGAALLPAASWQNILTALPKHFGADVTLSDAEKQQVASYLLPNATDKNSSKLSSKMQRDLTEPAPKRISTLPYVQRKHRKIDPMVFNRPAVDGLRNCNACHPGAEQGSFKDDDVTIPR